MLANGSTLETVDQLPMSDAKAMWVMIAAGIIGPYKEYGIAFSTTPRDKKTKNKPFRHFYPHIDDWWKCKPPVDHNNRRQQEEIARNAAKSLAATMPEHIRKKLLGG